MSHMNFHLPGGLPAENEEDVEEEIRDEHLVLVQRSNGEEEEDHQNDESGGDENAEWVFWERDSFEVQTEEADVGRYQPISWYESQQWFFIL